MWMVAGMVPKNGDVLTFGTTPSLVFGDGIADPAAVRAHAVAFGDIRNRDELEEGRLNASWGPEIGNFKGIDAGVGYSTRKVGRTAWFSLRYNLTPNMAIYADTINLGNEKMHEYANNETQFLTLENVGRRFNVGLRMAF